MMPITTPSLPPQVLIVTPTPYVALQLASEFSSLGCSLHLAASAATGAALALSLNAPHAAPRSTIICIDLMETPGLGPAAGLALAADLMATMRRGQCREAQLVGMTDTLSLDLDAAAHASGCAFVIEYPVSPPALHLLVAASGWTHPLHADLTPRALPAQRALVAHA